MWRRGGRSSALDRAEVLLSAKRSGRKDGGQGQFSAGGSVQPRSAPPNTKSFLSDLSDLSSVSSVVETEPHTVRFINTANNQGEEVDPDKDVRPPSSVGGRSRFLKKAPALTNRSQSPVSRIQSQQQSEPRYVTSSQRGYQTPALRRLADIESRVQSRKQIQDLTRQGMKAALTSTSDISPPEAPPSPKIPIQISTDPDGDQSPKGKRFLKKKATEAVPVAAMKSVGLQSSDSIVKSGCFERKSMKAMRGVSLESDEEDMRRLLEASEDSSHHSFSAPRTTTSTKKLHERPSTANQRLPTSPPPEPRAPLNLSLSSSPASPHPPRSSRDSPFRYSGRAQAHFSPSALSPSPSPFAVVKPSSSSHRAESPTPSVSSMSAPGELLSLEELFPTGAASQEPLSTASSLCDEFKINVMTLDDLVPATLGFTAEKPSKKEGSKHTVSSCGLMDSQQQEQQWEEEKEYTSDFESESRSAANHSHNQVSEHLHGGEEEEVLEGTEESSDASCLRTEGDYSNELLARSDSRASTISGGSQTSLSRGRSAFSKSSLSPETPRQHRASRRTFKEAAVQTQPDPLAHTWLAGAAALDSAAHRTYMDPTPVLSYTLRADTVEALSSFNPSLFALHEMLKQQLASTKTLIQSRRQLHTHLLQSLEPPNYRYTTLEDTKQWIQKHKAAKVSLDEALEEVMQDRRHCRCT